MSNKIKCTCGHSWNKSSSSKKDMNICHICGKDNTMKNGGWLDSYDEELQLGGFVYPTNYVPQAQNGYSTGDIASLPGVKIEIPLSKEQLAKNKKEVEERKKAENAKIIADRKARIKASEAAQKKPMSAKTLAEQTQATGDKFRLFPDDPNSFIDDYLNPGVVIGDMASGLGRIPYDVQQGNYGKAAMSVAFPLLTGALGGIGAKNAKEFANNLVNPLAGLKDAAKDVYSKVKGKSPKTNIKDYLSEIDSNYEIVDPETGVSKIIYDLNVDDQLSGLSKDYTKILPNDNAYREWADIIYPNLSENVSPAELKAAHEKSLEYFKGSILTGSGGKEHGLFIRNLLSEKIPQFNNPIIRDAKGNQLTQYNLGAHSTDIPIESEIKELLDKSGYDVSKFTANDWNIIDAYSKGYDSSINQLLRGKSKGASARGTMKFYSEQADVLKETILKNKAKEPFQTVRGVHDYAVDLLDSETYQPTGLKKLRSQLEKGDIFKDESFLSTGIPRNNGSSFGAATASEIIDIPGGGVQSIGIPEASSYPQYPGEREVILPPGLIRRVEEVEDATSPLTKGYRFRTSILNPYAVTGAIAAGTSATQQKRNGGYVPQAQNGIEGTMGGLTDQGFNYNGAWGGPSMQMGGAIPGSVGFTYARTGDIPSNGPYAKKTKASAQNGKEMKFYQEGLDWKPRNISRDGSVTKDDNGYWNPENWGKPVEIGSNEITMQGVYEPLLGISDTGDTQMMYPGEDYTFDGESVTEYPVAQKGISVPAPTTADSLKLFNAQIALNDFYNKEIKEGRLKRKDKIPFYGFGNPGNFRNENLYFYRTQIDDRKTQKGSGLYDKDYKTFFNFSPEQVRQLELKGLGQTKSGNQYQQYYRDMITPMQNLAAPFALIDTRVEPQGELRYEPPGGIEVSDYPGGAVSVYDYDPLAIKPYHLRTPKEKIEWNKKYGKPTQKQPPVKTPPPPVKTQKPQVDQFGLVRDDYIQARKGKFTLTPGNDKGDGYYELKKDGKSYKVYTESGGNSWVDVPKKTTLVKKPVTKPTPKKEQPTKQVEKPSTPIVKTTPPAISPIVEKRQNIYEGSPVYSPGAGIGMGSALVGFANQKGDTTYIKPEDYERFAVPKYGKEFIESKTKKKKNGGWLEKYK